MTHDLINRYIYAVTYHLPYKIQTDVEKELDSLISELLEERCGANEATEANIVAVLTKLGTPEQLATKYSGDENKGLINGMYYLVYKKVMRIVLPIAIAAGNISGVITLITKQRASQEIFTLIAHFMARIVGQTVGSAVSAFAVITIMFAILERKKVIFNNGNIISSLPPVPITKAKIKHFEPVISIIWQIFIAALLLNSQHSRSFWLLIGIWVICGIANDIARLIEGRYTKRLAMVTIVTHIIEGISAAIFLINVMILNAELMRKISLELSTGHYPSLLQNVSAVILGTVLLVLAIEIAVTVFKAWKYDK